MGLADTSQGCSIEVQYLRVVCLHCFVGKIACATVPLLRGLLGGVLMQHLVGDWDTHQLYTCTFEVNSGSNVADITITLRLCISTRLRLRHATATLISYPEKAAWSQVLRADVYGATLVCSMKDVMRSVVGKVACAMLDGGPETHVKTACRPSYLERDA